MNPKKIVSRTVGASLAKVYNQIRKQEVEHANAKKLVERELNAKPGRTDKQEQLELFNEDFHDKQHSIYDNSVDLIFTNPTNYTKLQIYRTPAHFANKVLKPGAAC